MVEELLPNLYVIRIPLSGSPLGWVNYYVIKGLDRNLVIDTGLNRRECLEAMQAGLGEIEVDLKKTDFYITHMHADHIGLAPRLAEDTSTIYINRPDKEYMENWVGWEAITGFARLNGFPAKEFQATVSNHPGYKWFATAETIAHLRYLEDSGQIFREKKAGCIERREKDH